MALTPPNDNKGDFNTSSFAPEVWTDVQNTNNQIIDRNDMPFASTVEYKGYYKAESTGNHTFSLTGSTNVTGYSWISSAPRASDHIVEGGEEKVKLSSQQCYGIIIPNSRGGGTWPFADPNVLGTAFRGYGYWPKSGGVPGDNYGNSTGWSNYYSGTNAPFTTCGYSGAQAPVHQYFLPGDIRTYGTNFPKFVGERGGPGWQAPEDPNFASPCWTGTPTAGQQRPLVRLENTFTSNYDANAVPRTMGKTSQVFLDTSFKAEGPEGFSTFERVLSDGDHTFVWPQQVSVYRTGSGKTRPERVQIRLYLKFNEAGTYEFEWRCRDGLKIWYDIGGGDARNFERLVPLTGANPCNLDSSNTTDFGSEPEGWKPGGGTIDGTYAGFNSSLTVASNKTVIFHGYGVGVPGNNTHGFSLVIKDVNSGEIVWTSEKLLENAGSGLVGVDECGYHALLEDSQRIPDNKISEFYTLDGWKGYSSGDIFTADSIASDTTARSYDTTRQYLWSNSTVKLRSGESVPGTVYLRQGDYYFIRTILSNHEDKPANYQFKVTPPTGGISQSVKFSGNGDPSSDTTVGGNAGGNGIPISVDVLCDSVLAPGGVANPDTNFAYLRDLGVVLNLNELNVSDFEIGREGQAEQLSGSDETEDPGSKVITFANNGNDPSVNITLSRLVRGGQDGLAPLTETELSAVFNTFNFQIGEGTTLPQSTFSSAITSRAVIQWGSAGNYPYIYHVVSDVVNSICSGVDIAVPVRPTGGDNSDDNNNNNNNQTTGGDCIDINTSLLSSNAAEITTACRDTCKTPNQFTQPEYFKNGSQYEGMFSAYAGSVAVNQTSGMRGANGWSNPSKSSNGNYDICTVDTFDANWAFSPRQVLAIPLWVPDVYVPDNFDFDGAGKFDCSFLFQLGSNTVDYNPDNVTTEEGVDRPYLACWVSIYPGTLPLGGKGKIKLMMPPFSSEIPSNFRATMSYDQFVADQQKVAPQFQGYLGNAYGARYVNYAPLKSQTLKNLDFNIPEVGSEAFYNLLSDRGYITDRFQIFGQVTSPDCSTFQQSRTLNRSGVDSSFRSAPDMIPFI